MNLKYYRFDEVTVNFDKKRVPLSSAQRSNRGGEFPYYGAQGVIDHIDDYIFDGEYLLIAEDGENLKSKKQNIAQIATGKFWVNNHAHIVTGNEKCDTRYLCYLINSMDLSGYITGSAQPKLSQANLNAVQLSMPTLEQQNRIVEYLVAIDNKIALNELINNNLEQQAQDIFDNMFPDISSGSHTIGEYISPKRGKGLLSKNAICGSVPVIAGGLEPSTYHNVANTQSPVLAISASGANAGYVSLWNIPIWSSDSSFIDSSMTDDVYFWYVFLKKRQKEIFDAQTGSAQPHIYPQHIASMSITGLDIEKVLSFTLITTPIFEMIGHYKEEKTILASTRDALLPKLMSGELDVSNIDI